MTGRRNPPWWPMKEPPLPDGVTWIVGEPDLPVPRELAEEA